MKIEKHTNYHDNYILLLFRLLIKLSVDVLKQFKSKAIGMDEEVLETKK